MWIFLTGGLLLSSPICGSEGTRLLQGDPPLSACPQELLILHLPLHLWILYLVNWIIIKDWYQHVMIAQDQKMWQTSQKISALFNSPSNTKRFKLNRSVTGLRILEKSTQWLDILPNHNRCAIFILVRTLANFPMLLLQGVSQAFCLCCIHIKSHKKS